MISMLTKKEYVQQILNFPYNNQNYNNIFQCVIYEIIFTKFRNIFDLFYIHKLITFIRCNFRYWNKAPIRKQQKLEKNKNGAPYLYYNFMLFFNCRQLR